MPQTPFYRKPNICLEILVTCFFFGSVPAQRSFVRIYDAKIVYGGDGILLSNYRLCRCSRCLETLIVSADSDGGQFHLEIVFSCPSGQCCSCPCYCRSVGCFSISRVFTVLSSLPVCLNSISKSPIPAALFVWRHQQVLTCIHSHVPLVYINLCSLVRVTSEGILSRKVRSSYPLNCVSRFRVVGVCWSRSSDRCTVRRTLSLLRERELKKTNTSAGQIA